MSSIVGGECNRIESLAAMNIDNSFLGGGRFNGVFDSNSVVGGGYKNSVYSDHSGIFSGNSLNTFRMSFFKSLH